MKRWTKDAKIGNVNDQNGEINQSDPSLELRWRYSTLCSRMVKIATLAAEHEETFKFAMENSDTLLEGIEKKLRTITIGENSTKTSPVLMETAKSMEQSSSPAVPIGIKRKENERGRRRYQSSLEGNSKRREKKKAKNQEKCSVEKGTKITKKNKKAKIQEIHVQDECMQINPMLTLPVLTTQVSCFQMLLD